MERIKKIVVESENIAPFHFTTLSDDIQYAISAYHQENPELQLGMITILRYRFRHIMNCLAESQTAYDSLVLESLYQIRMSLCHALEKKYSAGYIETATMTLENYQNACTIAKSSTEDIVKWIEDPKKTKKRKAEKKVTASTTSGNHLSQIHSKDKTTAPTEMISESGNQSRSNVMPPVKEVTKVTTLVKKERKPPVTSSKKTKAITQSPKSHSGPLRKIQTEVVTVDKSVSKHQPNTSTLKTTDMPTGQNKTQSASSSLPPVKKTLSRAAKDENKQQSSTSPLSPSINQGTVPLKKVTILKNTARVSPTTSYVSAISASESS
ncbi:MAG TPA: hypothetical protein PLD88_03490, partial [Candidatus Berkiella sp.]|nr:hypothetical protein [Candidatus Berkiella sp.]